MGKKFVVLAIVAVGMLSGCVSRPISVNYAPSSTMSATGEVDVVPFTYLPAANGTVEPNQIRNTAIGDAIFDQNIDVMVRDAVFKELRFVGVDVGAGDAKLTGEIQEFLIDDLGYSVDWTLRIKYTVSDASGATTYENVKEVQRNTNKFVNIFGSLNETIKLNVEELLKDPEFLQAI